MKETFICYRCCEDVVEAHGDLCACCHDTKVVYERVNNAYGKDIFPTDKFFRSAAGQVAINTEPVQQSML